MPMKSMDKHEAMFREELAVRPPPNESLEQRPEIAPITGPTPLPEPAIKFDNINDEDYGENEAENKTRRCGQDVIEQLVNKFLNTGSTTDQKGSAPKFVNKEAQKLLGSSPYWSDKGVKEIGSIKDSDEAERNGWMDIIKRHKKSCHQLDGDISRRSRQNSRKSLTEAQDVMSRFVHSTSMQAKQFDAAAMPEELKKQLHYVSFEGMSALKEKDHQAFTSAQDHINQQISETLTCEKGMKAPCTLKKIDISAIFNSENDADHLKYLWGAFVRNVARLKPHYKKILDLSNTAAQLNGFSDGGAMWRSAFDLSTKNSPPKFDLKQQMQQIYEKILPLYKQLHAYIRRQISESTRIRSYRRRRLVFPLRINETE
ncbi:unnamed protein product, partial [Mesorhabditis belari]|uniref:Uncharacterized protein n=1 Tax=Mesorhabditis belari TaxID=2138241 RepID=A0AAF3FSP7_9BILA